MVRRAEDCQEYRGQQAQRNIRQTTGSFWLCRGRILHGQANGERAHPRRQPNTTIAHERSALPHHVPATGQQQMLARGMVVNLFKFVHSLSMCNDWALLSARFVTMVCAIHVRCVESVLRATPYRRVRDTTMSQSKALLIHEWIPPADARREMLHRRPARSLTDFRGTSSNEVHAQALTSSVPFPSAHAARAWTCPRLQIDRKLTHTCMATDTPRRTHA